MRIEMTEFAPSGSYKTKTFTGPTAAGVLTELSFRSRESRQLHKVHVRREFIFFCRYGSGKIYRVWTLA